MVTQVVSRRTGSRLRLFLLLSTTSPGVGSPPLGGALSWPLIPTELGLGGKKPECAASRKSWPFVASVFPLSARSEVGWEL